MRIIGNNPAADNAEITAVASGALASGDTVVVNADGTVSVVSSTGRTVTQVVGSPQVFESATTEPGGAVFDSVNKKVVLSYRDEGNSNYGTAIVGTVDDTSITFGSPVVFASEDIAANFPIAAAFDSTSNKIVFVFQAGTTRGKAVVGTVSGTSISFGSVATFHLSRSYDVCAVFDSTNNKIVIGFRSNSQGEYGRAQVGTVNGTSISFGTSVLFNSTSTAGISCCFSPDDGKVVFAYKDEDGSNYGKAVVGTVSGTSISFGSEATFISHNTAATISSYDTTNNKVIVGYRKRISSTNQVFGAVAGTISGTNISFGSTEDTSTSIENPGGFDSCFDSATGKTVFVLNDASSPQKIVAILGTVSGTSISLGSSIAISSGAVTSWPPSVVFDSNKLRNVIAYRDTSNSNYGTTNILRNVYIAPNLTSENYIGIASNGYASGQAATINAKGFIDDNQSSLTAGQSYYVQTNGDLGLTADDPSVFAGTAVSATKLIVKG